MSKDVILKMENKLTKAEVRKIFDAGKERGEWENRKSYQQDWKKKPDFEEFYEEYAKN